MADGWGEALLPKRHAPSSRAARLSSNLPSLRSADDRLTSASAATLQPTTQTAPKQRPNSNNKAQRRGTQAMSSIGPQLPPHFAKRKRTPAPANNAGASPPPAAKHPRHHDNLPAADPGPDPDSGSGSSSSDDDDSFGPSLPSTSAPRRPLGPDPLPSAAAAAAPQRDEWMLAPPPSSSTFSERDPTRIRARKFASKPSSSSSKPSAPSAPSIWTETPEQKLRRLRDAVLGLGRSGCPDGPAAEGLRQREERDRAIAAGIEAQRGRSLLEEHQKNKKAKTERDGDRAGGGGGRGGDLRKEDEEDDPSKRAFDREKDMALGGRINTTHRRELVNKSANFGGRFQKGSYL